MTKRASKVQNDEAVYKKQHQGYRESETRIEEKDPGDLRSYLKD